jgi:hypothetical protein
MKYRGPACPHISTESYKAKDDIDHYAPELEEKAGYQRALAKLAL